MRARPPGVGSTGGTFRRGRAARHRRASETRSRTLEPTCGDDDCCQPVLLPASTTAVKQYASRRFSGVSLARRVGAVTYVWRIPLAARAANVSLQTTGPRTRSLLVSVS